MFKLLKKSKHNKARLGELHLLHGIVKTPCFMPVATRGALKGLTSDELELINTQIILANTYHLMQRPGIGLIKQAKGLHKFMNWQKPILTDSGGFQVFSLGKFRKIMESGIEFRSEINGCKYFLTPEKVIKMQINLGVDIAMVLDVCTPYPCSYEETEKAVRLTTKWARQVKNMSTKKTRIFAIIQGSTYQDLREKSIKELSALDFPGYAIGGECQKELYKVLDWTVHLMPKNKPRYLMGVGKPENIVESVKRGVDMFDCVIPARLARHGVVFCWHGKRRHELVQALKSAPVKGEAFAHKMHFYSKIHITNSKFKTEHEPINKNCKCYSCKNFTRSYINHLFKIKDPLGARLATIHNLKFFMEMMKEIRDNI